MCLPDVNIRVLKTIGCAIRRAALFISQACPHPSGRVEAAKIFEVCLDHPPFSKVMTIVLNHPRSATPCLAERSAA
jgi:hypothetical protein